MMCVPVHANFYVQYVSNQDGKNWIIIILKLFFF